MISSSSYPLLSLPLVALIALSVGAPACSGSEEPAAQERCVLEGMTAYGEGRIRNEGVSYSLDLSRDEISGSIGTQQVTVDLGSIPRSDKGAAPLRMRLFDAHSKDSLLDTLANATAGGPLTLQVFNASQIPAGSQSRTELADFDCGLPKGNICVQLGFDSTGDELILDDDDAVYNGIAGTVTIESINNISRKILITWDVEVGANILAFQDQSSGSFAGCMNPTYSAGTGGRWALK